ncbi:hypothetical protein DFH08DRAFT_808642 [Mycena albidolilacea]|uniref:Uncharacterized protein n=1 Tax=Mycena albidolilacea TaxID=1033008 RepID=A0AAD7A2X7_9AGAR|nr:hypothetical protein DFH08DRAFT_808642 [Mycena albidolilacea]
MGDEAVKKYSMRCPVSDKLCDLDGQILASRQHKVAELNVRVRGVQRTFSPSGSKRGSKPLAEMGLDEEEYLRTVALLFCQNTRTVATRLSRFRIRQKVPQGKMEGPIEQNGAAHSRIGVHKIDAMGGLVYSAVNFLFEVSGLRFRKPRNMTLLSHQMGPQAVMLPILPKFSVADWLRPGHVCQVSTKNPYQNEDMEGFGRVIEWLDYAVLANRSPPAAIVGSPRINRKAGCHDGECHFGGSTFRFQ